MKQLNQLLIQKAALSRFLSRLFMLVFSIFSMQCAMAQTTLNTTLTTGWSNNNGTGTVTFNFQNTNAYPILITGIEGVSGTAGATTAEIWIKTTPVSGLPGAISVANGWTQMATGTFTAVANTTTLVTQPFLTGLSVSIPAGVTYGMAITAYNATTTRQRYHSMVSPNIPTTTISGGGCNIIMGTNVSYGGGVPPTAPTNTPRGWIGKLTFVPAGGCTSPPIPGTPSATLTTLCAGQSSILSLTGGTGGTGQTFLWKSSPTSGGPYTTVVGSSSSVTITPSATAYYICEVTCGASTVASSQVLVTVSPQFPGGNYTINSAVPTGGTNFQTFGAAVSAISCGITGPVVFDVAPGSGPYTEQITLPSTIGSNAVKTVTFNGNGRTIQFASTDANNRHVIKLDGADYITFNELNIVANTGTYGWGMHFINGADFNNVNLCTITSSITDITSSNFQPVVMSNSVTVVTTQGNTGNNNTFIDNTFIGGYYSITMIGNGAGAEANGNNLTSNTFRDFYSYGIYLLFQKSAIISTCDISRPNRTASTTTAAVFMTTGNLGTLIENNRVHNFFDLMPTSTSIMYTFYDAADATAALPNQIINNVVYNIGHNGTFYGSYNVGGDYLNVYHNTFSMDNTGSTAGATYGIFQTTAATGLNYRNNMITISRGGSGVKVGLNFVTITSTIASNNNVVFLNSAGAGTQNYGNFGGVDYATLANWQTANGGIYDANSRQANPLYTSPGTGNFMPTSVLTNNVGSYIGVGYDINGTARSTVNPDPGAYEYTLFGLDAGIAWVSPSSPTTPGLQTITVNITNYLSTPITDLVLSYTDGGTPVTQTFSGLNIITAGSQNFSFTTQYNLTGFASMRAYINSVNGIADNVQLDDTTGYQSICYAMNGAYTINSGAAPSVTNFQSFTSFAAALNCGGVSGPVTVNVVSGSGPYVEQVSIDAIAGASGINTVTINGNNTTLTFPSGVFYYTLRLNGADYMTWNNLNIATSGTTNGIALNMTNASDNNNFNNCTFTVPLSATSTTTSCVAFSGSPITATTAANNGSNNTFSGCTMSGGYYCVSVNGNSTGNIVGNQFLNCNIKEYYTYGLYQTYASFTVVRDCIFERPVRTTTTTCYGVAFSTGSSGCLVERNRIRNMFGGTGTTTGTFYGLYCIIAATAGNENRFINNVISDINFNGTLYGIYFSGATFVKAYHNTVSLDHTACTGTASTYGIYSTGATSVDIQNNLVTLSRGGTGTKYCAYYTTMPTTTNYNDFFLNAAVGVNYIAYDGVTNFATLAAYQTGQPAKDQLSVSLNPNYSNPATFNYKPTEATLDNLGSNVGVGVDITGAVRGAIPDIGAYDFTVFPADLTVVSFVSPGNSGCYSAAENIVVTLKNNGSQPIDFSLTPATVTCDVTGAVTTSLVVNLTGTLASGATTNVTFPALNMTTNGTYSFNIYSTLAGDGDMSNNALSPAVSRIVGPVGGTVVSSSPSLCVTGTPSLTLSGHYGGAIQWQESNVSATGPWTNVGTGTAAYTPASPITVTTFYRVEISCNGNTVTSNTYTVTVYNPVLTGTTPASRCGYGSVVLGATVSPGNTANWYANPTGGLPLATGTTSFSTPNISTTTTFYAAASTGGVSTNTGMAAATVNATSGAGTTNFGLVFDVLSAFTLNTVTIYPISASGAAGTVTVDVINGSGAILHTATFNVVGSPAGSLVGQTLNLNFNIVPGTNYKLRPGSFTGITGLAFEPAASAPSGNYGYPYSVPGVLNILTSTLTAAPTNTVRNDLYYYFYNWSISSGCEGGRTPVVATITPSPTMTVTTADPILCPGGSTTVNVSSPNDPNYTYTWTSVPAGFTATGAGPHAVAPTTTTKYFALAQDNTAGPNAGCARLDSVTVNTAATLSAGTVSVNTNSFCVSGTPIFSVAGASGGTLQWQVSTVSATGPWTNVGTGANTYTPSSPVTQTSYYRIQASCLSSVVQSNVVTVTISNPQILSTTPGTRCGIGSVTLSAVPDAGVSVKWYSTATGGTSLFSGSSFATPTIASTTTFYAEPLVGLGGADSVAIPISTAGTTPIYHNMFLITSPTGMTVNSFGLKCNNTVGTLTGWDVYYRTDNYQLTAGANTSSAGWILLSSVTGIPSVGTTDYTFIMTGQALVIPPGATFSFYVAPAAGSTHQYVTNAIGTTIASNANASIISGNRGSTLFSCTTSGGCPILKVKYSLGCAGTRVPVLATVTLPPAMTITAADLTLCPGGSTTVSVSSPNDPNYTYSWTSNPAGFTASGAGPHNVTPTVTTKYIVLAQDNSAGPNAGCANKDSVSIIASTVFSAGTVSSTLNTICVSATPTLSVAGLSGGSIQWQDSSSLTSGLWVNVGTGAATYVPASPVNVTTYFRVQATCQTTSIYSNSLMVTVNSPQITSSTPGTRCGYGSVVLDATPEPGATLKWFSTPTGGAPLFTGAPFTTPAIASTTTFYAEASTGGGSGNASPIQVTELDLGGSDRLEIQNVSPDPINVNGWKVVVSNSYTDITSVNANIQTLSGTMNPGATLSWTDATAGPNYWGSNILWNPGVYPSFTGWAAILDNNNVLKDIVFMNWPATNIAAASITVGATVITVGTQWTGAGIDITTVAATNSVSRQGTSDNNNLSDFAIIPLSVNTTNPGMTIPFTGFGCQGIRIPVVATVTPPPAMTISATATTLCAGQSTTLSVNSPNDPNYTYNWNPGNLTGSSVTVTPGATTIYTLTAIDNTGGAFAGCGNTSTISVTVNPVLVDLAPNASPSSVCQGNNVNLASSATATLGYSMNPSSSVAFVNISATGTDIDLPANLQDDSEHNIAIPSFTFNGVTYTTARVAMNGVVVLGSTTGDVTAANGPLPSTANTAGNIFLAPYWDDLYPIAGVASVKTQTIGSNFIIQWTNATHFDDSISGNITFQVQLNLTSGVITYVYNDVTFGNPLMDGGISATVGIQMGAASALQYSSGTASLTAGQSISFIPNSVSVDWAGPNGYSSNSVNPVLSPATLLNNGTYTVTATGNNGCTKTATVNLVILPCSSTLNLTCFIEGYWDGTSAMVPVLANQGETSASTACDSIDVELHDAASPYAMAQSVKALLNQDGTATCVFPAVSGSYYIVVKNRSMVAAWSAAPVAMGAIPTSYNFTTAESQAYGAGGFPTAMKEVSTGVWAFYSGDIVVDENVDLLDLGLLETDISDFAFGYQYLPVNINYPGIISTDLNGDGNVDLLDSPILEDNISNFIFSNHP